MTKPNPTLDNSFWIQDENKTHLSLYIYVYVLWDSLHEILFYGFLTIWRWWYTRTRDIRVLLQEYVFVYSLLHYVVCYLIRQPNDTFIFTTLIRDFNIHLFAIPDTPFDAETEQNNSDQNQNNQSQAQTIPNEIKNLFGKI